jgi:hypothetical protein
MRHPFMITPPHRLSEEAQIGSQTYLTKEETSIDVDQLNSTYTLGV